MAAIRPTNNTGLIVDEFIKYATSHLNTISGVANTVSLYPPLNTPGPGIVNWFGYSVPPSIPDAIEFDEDNREEALATIRDIEVEYEITKNLYESQFDSEDEAFNHNKNVDRDEVIQNQQEIENVTEPTAEKPNLPRVAGGKDAALFKKCGNGLWPALGPGPSPNFQIASVDGARTWYKQNPEYIKKNCTQILFPTQRGKSKITVHKDLAAIVQPAIDRIEAAGLQKYIENCAGGLAVRNVTGGTRLSNHSWGTAIDMNTIKYPFGTKFGNDGIYSGKTKIRSFSEFDLGFLKVAQIFKSVGMTWLKNFDPMHVSIYE